MTARQALLAAFICGIGGAFVVPTHAAAFACPETSAGPATGRDRISDGLFAGADDATASNRLGELVADLRASGLKPSMIVDRLVGAYCPLVAADNALSDKQKTEKVRHFAQQATVLAYIPPSPDEVDVLVQADLPPELLAQVDQAASRGGMSRSEWILQAIKRQLAGP